MKLVRIYKEVDDFICVTKDEYYGVERKINYMPCSLDAMSSIITKLLLKETRKDIVVKPYGSMSQEVDSDHLMFRWTLLDYSVNDSVALITIRNNTNNTVMNVVYCFSKPDDSVVFEMGNLMRDAFPLAKDIFGKVVEYAIVSFNSEHN